MAGCPPFPEQNARRPGAEPVAWAAGSPAHLNPMVGGIDHGSTRSTCSSTRSSAGGGTCRECRECRECRGGGRIRGGAPSWPSGRIRGGGAPSCPSSRGAPSWPSGRSSRSGDPGGGSSWSGDPGGGSSRSGDPGGRGASCRACRARRASPTRRGRRGRRGRRPRRSRTARGGCWPCRARAPRGEGDPSASGQVSKAKRASFWARPTELSVQTSTHKSDTGARH